MHYKRTETNSFGWKSKGVIYRIDESIWFLCDDRVWNKSRTGRYWCLLLKSNTRPDVRGTGTCLGATHPCMVTYWLEILHQFYTGHQSGVFPLLAFPFPSLSHSSSLIRTLSVGVELSSIYTSYCIWLWKVFIYLKICHAYRWSPQVFNKILHFSFFFFLFFFVFCSLLLFVSFNDFGKDRLLCNRMRCGSSLTDLYESLDPRGKAAVCNREVPGWDLEAN